MKFIRSRWLTIFICLFTTLAITSAFADTVILASAPNRQGLGGEYIATFTGGILGGTSFNTFCIEFNETLVFGTQYNYAVSPEGARNGGAGGPNPDPISIGTAWLYSRFLDNQLVGYNEPTASGAQQEAFQKALWWLEHEQSSYSTSSQAFLDAALAGLGLANYEDLRANAHGAYGITAVNVTQNGTNRQDVLARVPEPGATLLLSICLVGIGLFARRKKWL